jgi:AraC-like DNA-binding protein
MAKTLVDFKPEISIDEIASLVGYSNISYFIQQYKKMFQTTPGQERHHVL